MSECLPTGDSAGEPAWRQLQSAARWPPLVTLLLVLAIVLGSLVAGQGLVTLARSGSAAPLSPAASTILFLLGLQVATIVLTALVAAFEADSIKCRLALATAHVRWRTVGAAILGGLALTGVYTGLVVATGWSNLAKDLKPFAALLQSPGWTFAVFAVACGAPLSEEMLFRGLLLPSLSRSWLRMPGAALVSTAAWSSLHAGYSIAGLVEVFLFGLYFSWLLWRTGSLVVPLACHAIINAVTLAFIAIAF